MSDFLIKKTTFLRSGSLESLFSGHMEASSDGVKKQRMLDVHVSAARLLLLGTLMLFHA